MFQLSKNRIPQFENIQNRIVEIPRFLIFQHFQISKCHNFKNKRLERIWGFFICLKQIYIFKSTNKFSRGPQKSGNHGNRCFLSLPYLYRKVISPSWSRIIIRSFLPYIFHTFTLNMKTTMQNKRLNVLCPIVWFFLPWGWVESAMAEPLCVSGAATGCDAKHETRGPKSHNWSKFENVQKC